MARTLNCACIQAFCFFLLFGITNCLCVPDTMLSWERTCNTQEIGFVTFAINSGLRCIQSCSISGLNTCLNNLLSDMGMSNVGDTSYLSSLDATDRIDRICRSYQTFKNCFDPLAQDCYVDDESSKIFFYTNEMYKYECNAGRADYVKYSDCFYDPAVQTETAGCVFRYTQPRIQNETEVCAYVSNILGCTGDIVYKRCGKDAATFYSTVNAYAQLMVYQLVSCPNVKSTYGSASNNPYKTGSRSPNGYTPMTSSVAVVLVAVLVAAYEYLNFA